MPDEPWNQLEIAGAAWGTARLGSSADGRGPRAVRPSQGHRSGPSTACRARCADRRVTFTNAEQETPIGEFGAYYVSATREPDGIGKLAYRLSASAEPSSAQRADGAGVHQRAATPRTNAQRWWRCRQGPAAAARSTAARVPAPAGLPIVHVLIPVGLPRRRRRHPARDVQRIRGPTCPGGLDGIALDLPALAVKPTHGALFPAAIPGEGPDLAASQHARRQRVGEARRGAHAVAGPPGPDPAGRQGPVSEHLRAPVRTSGPPRSTVRRCASCSRRAKTRLPNTRSTGSRRCATTTRTWWRNRLERAASGCSRAGRPT